MRFILQTYSPACEVLREGNSRVLRRVGSVVFDSPVTMAAGTGDPSLPNHSTSKVALAILGSLVP